MPDQTQVASVSVDGDKLAEALRRVSPFALDKGRENLAAVYAESDGVNLQLTACDGFRLAHLTVCLPFPVGNYLMALEGVKDFSTRHYNGNQVQVDIGQGDDAGIIKLGEVRCELVTTPYIDYPAIVPDVFEVEAIIDTKTWIKAIRGSGAEHVGIVYSPDGCRMYSQSSQGETIGCDPLPVQMFNGPEVKLAYKAEHFRRALTSCGPTATIQVLDPGKHPDRKTYPTLFEADDYWHLLQPRDGFPREVSISKTDREAFALMEEAVRSVRTGEVPGRMLMGNGKFYLEIGNHVTMTELILKEPILQAPEAETPTEEPAAGSGEPEEPEPEPEGTGDGPTE